MKPGSAFPRRDRAGARAGERATGRTKPPWNTAENADLPTLPHGMTRGVLAGRTSCWCRLFIHEQSPGQRWAPQPSSRFRRVRPGMPRFGGPTEPSSECEDRPRKRLGKSLLPWARDVNPQTTTGRPSVVSPSKLRSDAAPLKRTANRPPVHPPPWRAGQRAPEGSRSGRGDRGPAPDTPARSCAVARVPLHHVGDTASVRRF